MICLRLEFTVFQIEAPCSLDHKITRDYKRKAGSYVYYRRLGVSLSYSGKVGLMLNWPMLLSELEDPSSGDRYGVIMVEP